MRPSPHQRHPQVNRRYRYLGIVCALVLAATIGADRLNYFKFFRSIHLKAGDIQFLLRGKRTPTKIAIIAVDQKALDNFSELIEFWHPYYAEAILDAESAGAKVFGLDISFGTPVDKWEKDADLKLVKAVRDASPHMPVICSFVPTMHGRQSDKPVPVNMLASALGQIGFVNLFVDLEDDFVRRLELAGPPKSPPVHSLALRMAEKYLGVEAKFEPGFVTLGKRRIPLTGDRVMSINFAGPSGTFPTISLYEFLMAARAGKKDQLRQWVGDKLVLLGRETINEDRHPTPYYTLATGRRQANTYGVEVHANALYTLLEGDSLAAVPGFVRWMALALSALAGALIAGYLKPGWGVPALIVLTALTFGLTQWLFRSGRLLSASEMLLSALLALLATLTYRSLTAEKRGAVFHHAVGLFVGQKIASMLEESDKLPATGSRHQVTILFSDIRGFTAFCDDKDPAVVVELLNEYLRTMVGIIVRHKGHANKFIGDGIMAIFSDDDGSTPGDHVERAVRCGLEMATAQVAGAFRTGVGIHTGVALIGCVGSADKMEFTALGDTVNLASRLESLNKEYHTQLLLSDATRAKLDAAIETVCLGEVQVRGRSAPMNLYTLAQLKPAESGQAAGAQRR